MTSGLRLFAALVPIASCGWGSVDPEPAPAPRPALIDVPALRPPPRPLVCTFDPASRPGADVQHGFELCFTPGVGSPLSLDSAAPPGVPAPVASAAPPVHHACPSEMVLAEGEYCPKPKHKCLRYLDAQGEGAFLRTHRCAEYDRHPTCDGPTEHRRFCIDRDEYTPPGEELPLVNQSWHMAVDTCDSMGKRLCFESEWQFACMGPELWPYPYGFERDAQRCNHDLTDLAKGKTLIDHRVASASRPECTSPFGARNLVGNVDEWAWRDGRQAPWRSALRGGWWLAGRNNCIAATTAHDEYFNGAQTGFRCCKAAE